MQNRTIKEFSERTEALARFLRIPLRELPSKVGFSHDSLFAYRAGRRAITDKAWRKLEDAELISGMPKSERETPGVAVGEGAQAFYGDPRAAARSPSERGPLKSNLPFPHAEGPTPEECIDYLRAYLREAAHVPGMVGHTLIELKKRFPLDEPQRIRAQPSEKDA